MTTSLRHGYTTGACATACATAALRCLLEQKPLSHVCIDLPAEKKVRFTLKKVQFDEKRALCTTIKDAGDDPDVTDGAEIGAEVELDLEPGVVFVQGKGIGTVFLPGLDIPVGEPAINAVPRAMITQACITLLQQFEQADKGVKVKILAYEGEKLARRTLNERVGIRGGISILGTTGIVTPFSASSYVASIEQGLRIALHNGCKEIVLNAGKRSEKMLHTYFSHLPPYAFIHYGNWLSDAMRYLKELRVDIPLTLNIGMMLGKASKIAQGHLNTHHKIAAQNTAFWHDLAKACGYEKATLVKLRQVRMSQQLSALLPFHPQEPLYKTLLQKIDYVCRTNIKLPESVSLRFFLLADGQPPLSLSCSS